MVYNHHIANHLSSGFKPRYAQRTRKYNRSIWIVLCCCFFFYRSIFFFFLSLAFLYKGLASIKNFSIKFWTGKWITSKCIWYLYTRQLITYRSQNTHPSLSIPCLSFKWLFQSECIERNIGTAFRTNAESKQLMELTDKYWLTAVWWLRCCQFNGKSRFDSFKLHCENYCQILKSR